ncbi:MAG TPA: ion channel, partial [Burkholderiaceae bacterium]|nr:ion channel [Burkholderiaceae bacterium]
MKKTQIKRIRLFQRRGLLYAFILCTVIMFLGGLGFWILEPRAHTFADGMWLAFTTAATVGYGD